MVSDRVERQRRVLTALLLADHPAPCERERTTGDDPTANLLDGNLNTRYSSGTGQAPGMWIEVDMGATQTFNKVVLDSGSTKGDYSANSDVYVSNDGTNWTEVAQAISNGPVVVVSFPTQTARYIKVLNQSSSGSWWSIEEFYVVND